MDAIRDRLEQMFEELPRGLAICLVDEVGDCKLAGPVNADEKIQLALRSLHLGNIDMKKADGPSLGPWALTSDTVPVRQAISLSIDASDVRLWARRFVPAVSLSAGGAPAISPPLLSGLDSSFRYYVGKHG